MPGYGVDRRDGERADKRKSWYTGILFRYEFKNERKGIYKVKEFEEQFALYTGAVYAHAVPSGTAALKVALAASE